MRKRAPVSELLTRKTQALLIGRDALLILDLSLDSLDGISALNLQSDGLAGKSLDKDLHTSTETEN